MQLITKACRKQRAGWVAQEQCVRIHPRASMLMDEGHADEVALGNYGLDPLRQGEWQWFKGPWFTKDSRVDQALDRPRCKQLKALTQGSTHRDQCQRDIGWHDLPWGIFPIAHISHGTMKAAVHG